MNKKIRHYDMIIQIGDLPKPLHFYRITIQMLYALRNKYFNLYGPMVESIEVFNSDTKRIIQPMCFHSDELIDDDTTNPTKFYERYGW